MIKKYLKKDIISLKERLKIIDNLRPIIIV